MIGNGYDPFKSPALKNYFGNQSGGSGEMYQGYNPQFGVAAEPVAPVAPDGSTYANPYTEGMFDGGQNGGGSDGQTPGNYAELTGTDAQSQDTNSTTGLPSLSLRGKAVPAAIMGASMIGGPLAGVAANGAISYAQNQQQDNVARAMGYTPNTSLMSTMGSNFLGGILGGTSAVDQTTQNIDKELQSLQAAHKQHNLTSQPLSQAPDPVAPVAALPGQAAHPDGSYDFNGQVDAERGHDFGWGAGNVGPNGFSVG